MMDSNELRRYWCEKVGWVYYGPDGRISDADDPNACTMSDADLAEAVRVWWLNDPRHCVQDKRDGSWMGWSEASGNAMQCWMMDGPLAFLAAVKEVVDGQ